MGRGGGRGDRDRQKDREKDIERERERDRQTDRQTDRQRKKERERERAAAAKEQENGSEGHSVATFYWLHVFSFPDLATVKTRNGLEESQPVTAGAQGDYRMYTSSVPLVCVVHIYVLYHYLIL